MDYPKFSVLMSLYINEKVNHFDQCMQSLFEQTVLPSEIVIVFDGPLTPEMYSRVDDYYHAHPDMIKLIINSNNKGLGLALADGVPKCKYELIARMDTDDIARTDRFEKQLSAFMNNPDLDICGSYIAEFEDDPSAIVAIRSVPLTHKEICEYQKMRDAFNHVSVMFKKEAVIKAGNYQDCPLMEDSLLWVNMIQHGAKCLNIDSCLVYVRIGKEMYKRRGGLNYYNKYKDGRKKIYDTGYISRSNYYLSLIIQFVVCFMPNTLRGFIFKRFLHK